MAAIFLYEHKDFKDLLLIAAKKERIDPVLTEKGYLEGIDKSSNVDNEINLK